MQILARRIKQTVFVRHPREDRKQPFSSDSTPAAELGEKCGLRRKSIKPIALAAGAAARTLQEFLSFLEWDHEALARDLRFGRSARPGHGASAKCCQSALQTSFASNRQSNCSTYHNAFFARTASPGGN